MGQLVQLGYRRRSSPGTRVAAPLIAFHPPRLLPRADSAPGRRSWNSGNCIAAATPALIILLWSIPVAFFRNVPQTALISANRQELVFRTTFGAALLNLALNLALIPRWGMLGAAGATLGTELVRTVWTQVYAGRAGFPFPSLSRFWRPAAAAPAMAGALLAARPTAVWPRRAAGCRGVRWCPYAAGRDSL